MIWGIFITVAAVAATVSVVVLSAVGLLVVGDWLVNKVRWRR